VFLAVEQAGSAAGWAVPTLVALLADSRASIRALAAQTIGKVGSDDQAALAALRRGLRDNSPAVRKACQRALEALDKTNSAVVP
jgi:HEAT repeat protein